MNLIQINKDKKCPNCGLYGIKYYQHNLSFPGMTSKEISNYMKDVPDYYCTKCGAEFKIKKEIKDGKTK